MLKQEQVLQIEPQNELKFVGPFNVPVTSYIKLTNTSDKKVMFKIKTTAPKKYCVRPNSGLIEPNEIVDVAICLPSFLYDASENNKHKFMVQAVFAPETGDANPETLWKSISPEQLMNSKLKCVFELPDDQQQQQQQQLAETDGKGTSGVVTTATDGNTQIRNSNTAGSRFYSGVDDTAAIIAGTGGKLSSTTQMPNVVDIRNVEQAQQQLQKAAKEMQELRDLENDLRQENIRLKEEVLILQKQKGVAVNANRYAPPVDQQQQMYFILAVSVVVGLIGIIFGKFLL